MVKGLMGARAGLRRGNVLIAVIVAMVIMAIVIAGLAVFQMYFLRSLQGRSAESQNKSAAQSVADFQYKNAMNQSALTLGVLAQADVDRLNATLNGIVSTGGDSAITGGGVVKIDTLLSRDSLIYSHGPFTATDTALVSLPPGSELYATNDWPRRDFQYNFDANGLMGLKTSEIMIRAVVRGRRGSVTTTVTRVAFYKVPAYQHALYSTSANMELCAGSPGGATGRRLVVNGSVWADGDITAQCPDSVTLSGSLYAQRNINVAASSPVTVVAGGAHVSLGQILRTNFEQNVDGILSMFEGKVHSGGALGGSLVTSRFQDVSINGIGECADARQNWPNVAPFWRDSLACGNMSAYLPALHFRADSVYRASPSASAYGITCGQAPTTAGTCGALTTLLQNGGVAMSYTYMYGSAYDAAPDTTAIYPIANTPWRGILADTRREPPCWASIGGVGFRTLRCKTNAYGYILDMSALNINVPAGGIPGGLIDFARSPDLRNRPFQEVLVIKSGACIERVGPLTIKSALPVYIIGDLNTGAGCSSSTPVVPLLIDAPLVTVLPKETGIQLAETNRWDDLSSTSGYGLQPLRAYTSVTVRAVIRAPYHSGVDYGGTPQQLPSVMGDWSRSGFHLIGAAYGVETATPALSDNISPIIGIRGYRTTKIPANLWTIQPRVRIIDYDRRLLVAYANSQPPGSWLPQNMPYAPPDTNAWPGLGSRNRSRQANATGGFSVQRVTQRFTTTNGTP